VTVCTGTRSITAPASAPAIARWRRLNPNRQAVLVGAHLRNGETYTDLNAGFAFGTDTVYRRYLREAHALLAAMAPALQPVGCIRSTAG